MRRSLDAGGAACLAETGAHRTCGSGHLSQSDRAVRLGNGRAGRIAAAGTARWKKEFRAAARRRQSARAVGSGKTGWAADRSLRNRLSGRPARAGGAAAGVEHSEPFASAAKGDGRHRGRAQCLGACAQIRRHPWRANWALPGWWWCRAWRAGLTRQPMRRRWRWGTVGVVAGGVDVIYPPENDRLYAAIKNQGLILSEMRLNEAPQARHFPRRNRIISGFARGVVVVEAAEKSGALIPANYALEQGHEIFVVPCSPLDPRARGANRLTGEGATLTESAEDILSVLSPHARRSIPRAHPSGAHATGRGAGSGSRPHLRKHRGSAGTFPRWRSMNSFVNFSAPAAAVLTVILELELAKPLPRHPGNRVSWMQSCVSFPHNNK